MNTIPSWLASGHGGTPLVLLHGMGSTADIWLPQLQHFGRSGLTLAWTAPGYGNSPMLDTLDWGRIADALNSMLTAQDINQIHLLGHSIGGMMAQEFYHRFPHRVSSLILSATSAGFGSSDVQWQEDFISQRTEPLNKFPSFAQAAPELLDGFLGAAASASMRQRACLSAEQIERDRYLDYMRLLTTFNRKADLSSIAVPTLLLAGELDTQAPPKGMQRMAHQMPDARFHEFKGAKHMANIELPNEFNDVVASFLATATHKTES